MRCVNLAYNFVFGNGVVFKLSFLYADCLSACPHGNPTRRLVLSETAAVKLAEAIAESVFSGEFAPGARLDEQQLAQRFAVSRTPVREALRLLATSGLITVKPRRGAFVTAVSPAELEELFVAMGELEATCARLAAMSMAPTERRRLEMLHERMGELAELDDTAAFAEANHAFHTMIYAGAHNIVIADMTAALRRRLAPYRRVQFNLEGRPPRSHSEHGVVVRAIVTGDANAAHAAMLQHVMLIEASFEELVAWRTDNADASRDEPAPT
jgi:DNA-binding GntR family transcriptional regulator